MITVLKKIHSYNVLNQVLKNNTPTVPRGGFIQLELGIQFIFGIEGNCVAVDNDKLEVLNDLSNYNGNHIVDIVIFDANGLVYFGNNININIYSDTIQFSTPIGVIKGNDYNVIFNILNKTFNFIEFSYDFGEQGILANQTNNKRSSLVKSVTPIAGSLGYSGIFSTTYVSSQLISPLFFIDSIGCDYVTINYNNLGVNFKAYAIRLGYSNSLWNTILSQYFDYAGFNLTERSLIYFVDNYCVDDNYLSNSNVFFSNFELRFFDNYNQSPYFEYSSELSIPLSSDYNERFNSLPPLNNVTNVLTSFNYTQFMITNSTYNFILDFEFIPKYSLNNNCFLVIQRYENDANEFILNETTPNGLYFGTSICSEKTPGVPTSGINHFPNINLAFQITFLGYLGNVHRYQISISPTNLQRIRKWKGFRIYVVYDNNNTYESHLVKDIIFKDYDFDINPLSFVISEPIDSFQNLSNDDEVRLTHSQSVLFDIKLQLNNLIANSINIKKIRYGVIDESNYNNIFFISEPILFDETALPLNNGYSGNLNNYDTENNIFIGSDNSVPINYRIGKFKVDTLSNVNILDLKIPILFRVENWIPLIPNSVNYYDTNEPYNGWNYDFENYGQTYVNNTFVLYLFITCDVNYVNGINVTDKTFRIGISTCGFNYSLNRTAWEDNATLFTTNVTFEINSVPTLVTTLDEIKGVFKINNLPSGHYLYEVRIWKKNSSNSKNHSCYIPQIITPHNRHYFITSDLNVINPTSIEWYFNNLGVGEYICDFVFAFTNDFNYDYYTRRLNIKIKDKKQDFLPTYLTSKVINDCCQIIELPKYYSNNCETNKNIKDWFRIPLILPYDLTLTFKASFNNQISNYLLLQNPYSITLANDDNNNPSYVLFLFDLNEFLNYTSQTINALDFIEINGIKFCFKQIGLLSEFIKYEFEINKNIKIGGYEFKINNQSIDKRVKYLFLNSYINNIKPTLNQESINFNSVNETFNYSKELLDDIEIQHEFIHWYERWLLEFSMLQDYLIVFDGNSRKPFNTCNGLEITNFNSFETETFEYSLFHGIKVIGKVKKYKTNIC